MGEALRRPAAGAEEAPEYLPARMVNEYAYCPRLFHYEWVQGIFRESVDTEEGKAQHRRVDKEGDELPGATADGEERIHARSITLASEEHRLIAKMDLIQLEGRTATPVDYKHGRPRETEQGLEVWEPEKVQLAVQAIVLRENGYECEEGVIYYAKTRQRVRVAITDALVARTLELAKQAWETAAGVEIPAPLEDSPKCGGCSLAPVCLPDETGLLREGGDATVEDEGSQLSLFGALKKKPPRGEVRRMVTARDDLRPVYLNTQGLRVGKSGGVLQVKEKDKVVQEVRLGEVCQVNLMGNIQISTQAVQALCEAGIPISYFSQGGWFYGVTTGMGTKNVFLRRQQFRLAEEEWFCLRLARKLVAGKIRNQRVMLLRNHVEPEGRGLAEMKEMAAKSETAGSLEELLGIEGNAARVYFGAFAGMLKAEGEEAGPRDDGMTFDFTGRNRRPPRDPVNALLSLGYSLLAKDLMVVCHSVGFDPMLGFYHQPRFGRPALALDLMEPFRPLIADSAVLSAINTKMVGKQHFVKAGEAVALTPEGRKAFFRAYELRMDTLVTHPMFEYRVSYRRLLEIQARLLMRVLEGEIGEYPAFVTR